MKATEGGAVPRADAEGTPAEMTAASTPRVRSRPGEPDEAEDGG